ncbi:unnamed protein product [Heterobilharzia americana]|nr:unnamed protein product [Heterobilharzia americana]
MVLIVLCLCAITFSNGLSLEELHQETAPSIVHVSPKGSIKPSDYMEIMVHGFSAEAIVRWIADLTQIQIRVFRPPSYTGTMLLALFMSLGAAVLYFRRINLECLYNRSLWSAISLGIILCAISGQVYNHIRGPPLFHAAPPKGEIKAFIYGGSDYQFVAETFIVMILYIACSGGILLMNEVGSTTDPTKRKVFTISGIALFMISVNLILSVFRKNIQVILTDYFSGKLLDLVNRSVLDCLMYLSFKKI